MAGEWVILCARLNHTPADRAHAWLLQTLHELEQEPAQAQLFRVEIENEKKPAMTATWITIVQFDPKDRPETV